MEPMGRYRRPPGARWSRAPSSMATGTSAPVGPPLNPPGNQSEAAAMSSGIPETSPSTAAARIPARGSNRLPSRKSTVARPRSTALRRAISIAFGLTSVPNTRAAPSLAATNDSTPDPDPTSMTVSPGLIFMPSAISKLVRVGANTPGASRIVKGPPLPSQVNGHSWRSSMVHLWYLCGRGAAACRAGGRHTLVRSVREEPLDIEIRPITPEEYGDFAVAAESAFGHQPKPEELEIYRKIFEFERSLAAFEAGTIVATAGAQSLPVTVPGG